jgi:RNA polymerase sigma-70 factor (ECF subfamily)
MTGESEHRVVPGPAQKPNGPGLEDDWGKLMAAAQAGNGGAYRRLLTEVGVWLRRYFTRRLPFSMVDDAVQETLIAIHGKRHTYEPDRPFRPWLAVIARYKWIDRLRALGREATAPLDDNLSEPDHGSAVTSAILLERLLNHLKPAQADVIRMVKLNGDSVEDASNATGQSISLVKVNIHRGLAKLTALVESNGDWV